MKQVFGILLLFILINTNMYANLNEIAPKVLARIEQSVEKMGEVMKLKDQQKSKILELKKVVYVKQTKLMTKFGKGTEEFKSAKTVLKKNFYVMLKQVCSREQMKLWADFNKDKEKI